MTKSIKVIEIEVRATLGSALWDCQRDAAILALTELRKVRLIHNDVAFIADPDKITANVVQES